jgi:UDP-N-acetylmuramate-alanine ligase
MIECVAMRSVGVTGTNGKTTTTTWIAAALNAAHNRFVRVAWWSYFGVTFMTSVEFTQ